MIKYRVYDTEQKRYLNINNVSISGSGILRVVTYEDGYHTGISQLPNENSPRFIIEQYTGLRDKNGVEIYEGDILLRSTEIENDKWIFEQYKVEFSNGKLYGAPSDIFEVLQPEYFGECAITGRDWRC